jgi:formylmethanofuran dehydrogenase subunit E
MKEVDWDYLYDKWKDDKAEREFEELQTTPKEFIEDHKAICEYCGEEFDIDDLDRYDGKWICRNCEENLNENK